MKLKDTHIWIADSEVTKPLCIANDDASLTVWIKDGEILGVLRHEYVNGYITNVTGTGSIPAEYVATEENLRL